MFRDVIQYLDEFSAFPTTTQATDNDRGEDPLVQSYVELANAAFNVGQNEEAVIAARSALKKLKSNPYLESSAALLLQRSSAARALFVALRQDGITSSEQLESYASECLHSLEAARRLDPDDHLTEVFQLSTLVEFLETGNGHHHPSARQSQV